MKSPSRHSLPRIFGWPVAIGVTTAIGLVAGLVGDGLWDAASWIALALPLVACRNLVRR